LKFAKDVKQRRHDFTSSVAGGGIQGTYSLSSLSR